MTKIETRLETLLAKLRALPEDRQEFALQVLTEIVDEEVYVLSEQERAILEPALRDAKAGKNLSDADTDDLLTKPWA